MHTDFRQAQRKNLRCAICSVVHFIPNSLRQMAAIVLRRNFASLWKTASISSQTFFKTTVTEALSKEHHDQVDNAIAALISQVFPSVVKIPLYFLAFKSCFRLPFQFFLSRGAGLNSSRFCKHVSPKEAPSLKYLHSAF